MEAKMTFSPAQQISSTPRFRAGLILSGIIVAVIVSLFVLHEAGVTHGTPLPLPRFGEATAPAAPLNASVIHHFSSFVSGIVKF